MTSYVSNYEYNASSISIKNTKPKINPKQKEITYKDSITEITENQCSICLDNKKCMLFSPCNHVSSCHRCSKKIKMCPICREAIKDSIIIYI